MISKQKIIWYMSFGDWFDKQIFKIKNALIQLN